MSKGNEKIERQSAAGYGRPGRGGRGMAYDGSKVDLKASWKKIFLFVRKYWAAIIIALVASAGGTILNLLGPDKLSDITNLVTKGIRTGIDLKAVARLGFILVAFYAGGFALTALQNLIMASVTQGIAKDMRSGLGHKINVMPLSYFNTVSTGDVLSRVTNDVDTVSQSFTQSIGPMVSGLTLFIGSAVMMLKTNLIMTAAAVAATLIGFGLMKLITGHSQKYFISQQRDLGAINGHVEEVYTGHMIVKAYNGEEAETKKFDRLNEDLRNSAFKAQGLSGLMMPLMQFVGNFGYVVVCVTGAVLALKGRITVGVIVAFMLYVRYFTQPLAQIAQAMQSLQSAAAAGDRVFEFLDARELPDESGKHAVVPSKATEVEFDHVRFGYDPSKVIIHDFSMKAEPGQKIAIVGPTGAGKSTLINLLMRFYEPDSGSIKIGGVDTKDMTREQVHNEFCMVLQETWLFEGTIRENLTYGSENVSDEEMERACRAVGISHFIHTLPKGYDTVLDDNMSLSQGQRQQLTIARAMIEDKPMLILDEATSSVDTRTELKIQKAMDELMKGRTSFVIAHRLSTIKNADLILVLKDGDVVESGTHEELLKKNGFYADLYNSQFDQMAEAS